MIPASNETLHYIHQMARTAGLRLREQDLETQAEIERGSGIIYDAQVAAACLKLFREKGYVIPG